MIEFVVIFGAGTAFGVLCDEALRGFYRKFIKPRVLKAASKVKGK